MECGLLLALGPVVVRFGGQHRSRDMSAIFLVASNPEICRRNSKRLLPRSLRQQCGTASQVLVVCVLRRECPVGGELASAAGLRTMAYSAGLGDWGAARPPGRIGCCEAASHMGEHESFRGSACVCCVFRRAVVLAADFACADSQRKMSASAAIVSSSGPG